MRLQALIFQEIVILILILDMPRLVAHHLTMFTHLLFKLYETLNYSDTTISKQLTNRINNKYNYADT